MRNRIESVSLKRVQNYSLNLKKKLGEGSQGSVFLGWKLKLILGEKISE